MAIPKLNKEYNCFDDGKVSKTRLYVVEVKEIVPFKDIDEETLSLWKEEVKNCYWLYRKKTDFFIKTTQGTFVRTKDNGWFSIGGFLCGGRMDVDGKLTKRLDEIYNSED